MKLCSAAPTNVARLRPACPPCLNKLRHAHPSEVRDWSVCSSMLPSSALQGSRLSRRCRRCRLVPFSAARSREYNVLDNHGARDEDVQSELHWERYWDAKHIDFYIKARATVHELAAIPCRCRSKQDNPTVRNDGHHTVRLKNRPWQCAARRSACRGVIDARWRCLRRSMHTIVSDNTRSCSATQQT